MKESSKNKKRMGHFEKEAIVTMAHWILLVLLSLAAAYIFPHIIKLFLK